MPILDKLLLKNIFSLFSIQAVNYILPLLILPRLINVLGIDLFGIYILIFTVVQYFIIASDYGFNLTATRKIAILQNDHHYVSKVFMSVLIAKLLISIIGLVIINMYIVLTHQYYDYLLYVNISYLSVFGFALFPIWLYQAYEKMVWIAVCNFISRSVGLVLIYIFVNTKKDLEIAIIIQAMMPIIAAIIALKYCLYHKMVTLVRFRFSDVICELKDGWDVFISTSFVSLYTTSIPLLLGFTSGAESVGMFSAADKIRAALQSIINPISQSLYPRVNKLMLDNEHQAHNLIKVMFKIFVIPFFIFSFFLMRSSDFIINIFYGGKVNGAGEILGILVWVPPIVSIANLLGIQIMLPKGMSKQFSITYIFSGLIGFPLLFLSAYYYSVIGVSYACILIEVVVVILFAYFICKRNNTVN